MPQHAGGSFTAQNLGRNLKNKGIKAGIKIQAGIPEYFEHIKWRNILCPPTRVSKRDKKRRNSRNFGLNPEESGPETPVAAALRVTFNIQNKSTIPVLS